MLTRRAGALAIAVALLATAAAVGAHHGWSGYDSSRPLDLTGVIREAGYEHPHAYLRLEAPEKAWVVVLAPPSRMERRGVTREMLKVGTAARVVGYPHRTEPDEMRAERLTINGKTVELR
jgi:hypothetical protein